MLVLDPKEVMELLKCRAWNHDLDFGQTDNKVVPVDGFHEVCRCTRCGTERITWIDWEGHPISRWYDYPETYQQVSSISKAEARLLLYNQRNKKQRRTA